MRKDLKVTGKIGQDEEAWRRRAAPCNLNDLQVSPILIDNQSEGFKSLWRSYMTTKVVLFRLLNSY